MSRIAASVPWLVLGFVALVLKKGCELILEKEYPSWASALARLMVRLSGMVCARQRRTWWADLRYEQQVLGQTGLAEASKIFWGVPWLIARHVMHRCGVRLTSVHIRFRGERMVWYWPLKMLLAQFDRRVPLQDGIYRRVRYGESDDPWRHASHYPCHDCGIFVGEFHVLGCDAETCPRCLGQLLSCGCSWGGGLNGWEITLRIARWESEEEGTGAEDS